MELGNTAQSHGAKAGQKIISKLQVNASRSKRLTWYQKTERLAQLPVTEVRVAGSQRLW